MRFAANDWNRAEVKPKMQSGQSLLSVQELELVSQAGISEAQGTLFFNGYLMMQVMWRDTGSLCAPSKQLRLVIPPTFFFFFLPAKQ